MEINVELLNKKNKMTKKKENFHKKRNGCEIEGYMDMTNEDKPKFPTYHGQIRELLQRKGLIQK